VAVAISEKIDGAVLAKATPTGAYPGASATVATLEPEPVHEAQVHHSTFAQLPRPSGSGPSNSAFPGAAYPPGMFPPGAHPGTHTVNIYGTSALSGGPAVILQSEQQVLVAIWSLGRSVRTLAMIDLFFLLLNSLYFTPVFFLFMCGPCFGYSAGKNYNKNHASIYSGYYVLRICLDFFTMSQYSTSMFNIFALMVDLFIFTFVTRYAKALRLLSPEETEQLRSGSVETMIMAQTIQSRAPPGARMYFAR
jgi:hypothetical protein